MKKSVKVHRESSTRDNESAGGYLVFKTIPEQSKWYNGYFTALTDLDIGVAGDRRSFYFSTRHHRRYSACESRFLVEALGIPHKFVYDYHGFDKEIQALYYSTPAGKTALEHMVDVRSSGEVYLCDKVEPRVYLDSTSSTPVVAPDNTPSEGYIVFKVKADRSPWYEGYITALKYLDIGMDGANLFQFTPGYRKTGALPYDKYLTDELKLPASFVEDFSAPPKVIHGIKFTTLGARAALRNMVIFPPSESHPSGFLRDSVLPPVYFVEQPKAEPK